MPMDQLERYRGKQICGLTVYEIAMGHEDVPEALKEAGRRFGFPPDAYTGDWIRAVVSKDGFNFFWLIFDGRRTTGMSAWRLKQTLPEQKWEKPSTVPGRMP